LFRLGFHGLVVAARVGRARWGWCVPWHVKWAIANMPLRPGYPNGRI
jgi:hypothetical protein